MQHFEAGVGNLKRQLFEPALQRVRAVGLYMLFQERRVLVVQVSDYSVSESIWRQLSVCRGHNKKCDQEVVKKIFHLQQRRPKEIFSSQRKLQL
jgi:hypothetical protein